MSSTAYPPLSVAYPLSVRGFLISQPGVVAGQVVAADPALHHSGVLVARVLDSHCDRLLRDLVHDQVSEGLVRFQCRGDSVVVAGVMPSRVFMGGGRCGLWLSGV